MDHRHPFLKDSGVMEEDEYEDSRLFLSMLDAATERIFDSCSELMAAESSAIVIACNSEAFRHGTTNLLQDSELWFELSPMITVPPAPQASSFPCRPRKRRKRSWTPDQPVLEQSFAAMKINKSPSEITWASTPIKGQAKETLVFPNNFCQRRRKGESKDSNVGSSMNGFLAGAMLPPTTGNDGKCETQYMEKCADVPRDIHEAIDMIASLIPSLQKFVSSSQTLADQKGAGHVELQNNCSSICENGQCSNNALDQKETSKRLRFQTQVPSVGSSSFRKPKRTSSMEKSGHNVSKFRDTVSEETSWTSFGSSSEISTSQSGYPYPSSVSGSTYSSLTGENEGEYDRVGQSSSESRTDYEASSYDSQEQYSDRSEGSSARPQKWEDHQLEKRKRVGRISKFGKKLGTIFHHHHHHHHHHYSGRNESGLGHVGFLKRLGKMFRRRGKSDDQRLKPEKPQKPVTRCVTKKRQEGGHFRALKDGFMRHMKHSKKSEKAKDTIGRLGSVRHKGRKGTKKFSWWPKMGRDKVKAANKGKVKLGRAMTRAKRSQFAAARMILK